MSLDNDYAVLSGTGSTLQIDIPITWDYNDISDFCVWQQDNDTGEVATEADGMVYELYDATTLRVTNYFFLVEPPYSFPATIYVGRRTTPEQSYNANAGQAIDPVKLTAALDKLMALCQELKNRMGDDHLNPINSVHGFEIPDDQNRINGILGFDENGDPTYLTLEQRIAALP